MTRRLTFALALFLAAAPASAALVTHAGSTWNTTAGNKTVVATPVANNLIVVVHGMSNWVSGDTSTITDNNADGLGTYTKICGGADNTCSDGGGTAGALFVSVRNALIGSATSTTFTATNVGDTGGGLSVFRVTLMTRTGASAVRQFIGESTQTENPTAIDFGAATLTANPIILAHLGEDNPAATVPPTGFTESTDTGWATPTTGIELSFVNSGQTSATYTWAAGGAFIDHNEVGIELDTSAAPLGCGTSILLTGAGCR